MHDEMQPALYNKNGSLAHSHNCRMAFGRKDKTCPRCVEMMTGAPARSGWQNDYYKIKAQNDKIAADAIAHHFKTCKICNGVTSGVCTWGDY